MVSASSTIHFLPSRAADAAKPQSQRVSVAQVEDWLSLPLPDLISQAQAVHRQHFDACEVQLSSLLSVKTGGCPEDCAYCPQSVHYDTGVGAEKMLPLEEVVAAARAAQAAGATRFCMGAAWRAPNDRDVEKIAALVTAVRETGMQTCATLGMLTGPQAATLKASGLHYYNHNLDTAPEFYGDIISTRDYQDRLDTLQAVRDAGIKVCAGGIVGMGENRTHRAGLIAQLANLDPYPESVPINMLVRVAGTPLAEQAPLDPFEFVRTIAAARLAMPKAWVRLSAGRRELGDTGQALCFLAGANSIFYGEKLLITGNPDVAADQELFARLGLRASRV
jgi:biotin synthase